MDSSLGCELGSCEGENEEMRFQQWQPQIYLLFLGILVCLTEETTMKSGVVYALAAATLWREHALC
jgi:hypothetical protein